VSTESSAEQSFAEELAQLTGEQRAWVAADLQLRARANQLAAKLGLDGSDVYHQLKQLARSPSERLARGLNPWPTPTAHP
jgi:hypothetical protein